MKTKTLLPAQNQIVDDAKRAAGAIDLAALAGRYTQLNRVTPVEHAAPCPKCGGVDRFHVTAKWFFCRQCHPQRGDVIEFLQWMTGATFKTVCAQLTNGVMPATPATPAQPTPKTPVIAWDEPKQRGQAIRSHNELIAQRTPESLRAMGYLRYRGIDEDTIRMFRVGCRFTSLPATWDAKTNAFTYPKQMAVSMPWFDPAGAMVGVKYRFLESHTYTNIYKQICTENKTSRGQSIGHVFGWNALRGAGVVDTLVICEGELNAMSLWQVGRDRIDVLSAGSESVMNRLPLYVVEAAATYRNVIVWADRGQIADGAAQAIGASSMRSPGGMDANDLLRSGKLRMLIDHILNKLSAAGASTQPVIADVTAFVGRTVDNRTCEAIQRRVQALGWTIDTQQRVDGWKIERITACSEGWQ